MKLKEAFGIKPGEVISLVGGGGKTTLMFALASELASGGKTVVTTTTTKIFEPSSSESSHIVLQAAEQDIVKVLLQKLDKYGHITLARDKSSSGKLIGVSPELVVELAKLDRLSYIIVEADGAARKSLKAPSASEPVIPYNTSLVVPMVGVDAVGCRLTEENVFRPEVLSRLLRLPLGEVISAEAIAFLITHPRGTVKGSPVQARIIPFLNKVDSDQGLSKAMNLANKILEMGHPKIERVILGQAQLPERVAKVVSRLARS